MKVFMMFRSDLTILEYYHAYKNLEIFETNCHDYYMLLPLWLLQKKYFDRVYIIRIKNKNAKIDDIVFDINGKKYIQTWVDDLKEVLDLPSPDVSFFRGGFKIYDNFVKKYPTFSKLKLYLGAGKRVLPQYGGNYDTYLMEDKRDFNDKFNCVPFFKTASPQIFHPVDVPTKWDICWPCNFTQIRYKGQELFIKEIAKSSYLQSLKIVHCGNKPEVGKQMCLKYGVTNIEFMGLTDRKKLNMILNMSSFGLNLSNIQDGCPRVSTEVLMSGTPLIIKTETRLLDFYKENGVVMVNEKNLAKKIEVAMKEKYELKRRVQWAIENTISFNETNKKNINIWQKI